MLFIAWWTGDLASLLEQASWRGLAGGVYVGLFEMGLAFVLWLQAMKHAENTARIANLIFIAPFLSLLLISTLLDEAILLSTIIGLVLIIAGLLIQQAFPTTQQASTRRNRAS
jgi:drug/metabolite transporter (DMT)-like permease